MADTRINALTTATSSASDDYLPIDGTTNGTKKLSAYSPSFGGDLTVSGLGTFAGILGTTAAAQRITNTGGAFQIYKDSTPTKAARFSFNVAAADSVGIGVYNGTSWTDTLQVNTTQALVTTTTDSTTKDTGCLVLEGGLGVEKAVNIGTTLTVNGVTKIGTSAATAGLFVQSQAGSFQSGNQLLLDFDHINGYSRIQSYSGTAALPLRLQVFGGDTVIGGNLIAASGLTAIYTHGYNNAKGLSFGLFARGSSTGWTTGLHFYSDNTDVSASWYHNPTNGDLTLYSSASSSNYLGSDRALLINTSKQVQVLATTASTSTSSGALVVSGGVGVAGNVSSGGQVAATGTGTSGPYIANSAVIDYDGSTARFYGRGPNTSTRPSLGFYSTYSDGAGGLALMTFNTSGAATLASSLTTSAPSGGTAAAWKLGTVASVSPTSPNRTIEVEIGGTTYYLHAKTTNN